jgi:hypothetical protein
LALTAFSFLAPPAQSQEARITLEAKWLLLRKEDVSPLQVQVPDQAANDGRAQITTRRFEPAWATYDGVPPVPTLTVNKLWLANDIATAQQIFNEQTQAGFAEATTRVDSVGPIDIPGYGEQSTGIGGCHPCDSNVVHFRIVFRYVNAVHALYIYGSNEFAYQRVAMHFASIIDERVKAVPQGPPQDVVWAVTPRQVALSAQELGQQVLTGGEQEGSDGRSQWFWARFTRAKELVDAGFGPLDIYSKVWVAADIDTAREIYAEEARPGYFPEAKETVGDGQFAMENKPGVGNDNFGWTACNENCGTKKFKFLHHRYVFRVGNVVAVIYTWGEYGQNSSDQVGFYANSMSKRIK